MNKLIVCCEKCPNKTINQDYCYNGKSTSKCPAYKLPDHIDNKSPEDIDDMLKND